MNTSATVKTGFVQGGETSEAVFKVRVYKDQEIKGKASVASTRGGVIRDKEFVVK